MKLNGEPRYTSLRYFNNSSSSDAGNRSSVTSASSSGRSSVSSLPILRHRRDSSGSSVSGVVTIGSVKIRFSPGSTSRDNKNDKRENPESAKTEDVKEDEKNCCGVRWAPSSRIPLVHVANNRPSSSSSSAFSSSSLVNVTAPTDAEEVGVRRVVGDSSSAAVASDAVHRSNSVLDTLRSGNCQKIAKTVSTGCFGRRGNKFSFSECDKKEVRDNNCCRRCGDQFNTRVTHNNNNNNNNGTFTRGDKFKYCRLEDNPSTNIPDDIGRMVNNCEEDLKNRDTNINATCHSNLSDFYKSTWCQNNATDDDDREHLISTVEEEEVPSDTLDRFQKFRFAIGGDASSKSTGGRRGSGGGGGGSNKKKFRDSNNKSLKKLTDKLKTPAPIQKQDSFDLGDVETSRYVASREDMPRASSAEPCSSYDDDILDGVNLKLAKPESRSIVGSYYQRTIPFRSASFSRGYYQPEGGKYSTRLCRRSAIPKPTASCAKRDLPEAESPASQTSMDQEQTVPVTVNSLESQRASPLKTTVTPLIAPAEVCSAEATSVPAQEKIPETFLSPQPPKRTKHRYKHRHKHCGKLYFSDENIFISNVLLDRKDNEDSNYNNGATEGSAEDMSTVALPDIAEDDSAIADVKTEPPRGVVRDIKLSNVEEVEETSEGDLGDQKSCNIPSSPIMESPSVGSAEGTKLQGHSCDPTKVHSSDKEELLIQDQSPGSSSCTDVPEARNGYVEISSPEETVSRLRWSTARDRRKLVTQSSEEQDDTPSYRRYPLKKGDSLSEAESEPDRRALSPSREGRLSPSPYSLYDTSDTESRSSKLQFPIPYSKRPLRGPYLEMIVNEKRKPSEPKYLETQSQSNLWTRDAPRATDDCLLRRSNTSPAHKLDVDSIPKRKISANIPLTSTTSFRSTTSGDRSSVCHQRTTSSPSQLEFYPDQLQSQQLLQQLLRGCSEQNLSQDSNEDLMKPRYVAENYKDTRSHVIVELYDTERSYVEALKTLVTKYLEPLKKAENAALIEPYVLQEIFYQVPEIMSFHEMFLEDLRTRLEGWNSNKCIGDIFLETFRKQEVIDSYMAFIGNWKSAKEAIKSTCQSKPAFARFLDNMAREHKGKLALDSLLIMPVQRIPRYELLIQTLMKHTESSHPDYEKLIEAQKQVHELAVRINCTDKETDELTQLENLIDGLNNLVSVERYFLRYDVVTMICGQGQSRKDRAFFLFNDLLVIASMKRRSSTVKRMPLGNLGNIAGSLEANKYKLLMKIPLEHLDIVKVRDENLRKQMKDMEYLSEDITTLSQMSDLVSTLHCPHNQLEESIKEMLTCLNKQLSERQINETQLCYMEMAVYTRNSVENISVIFPKPEKKTSWEETFIEAKERLTFSGVGHQGSEFLSSVPIRKTRAGLQFTCACASYNQKDVWVCNSDGYVGQVCILSLYPEPAVTSCNGVCNARILCVTSVPTPQLNTEKGSLEEQSSISRDDSFEESNGNNIPAENSANGVPVIHLDSSSSSSDDDETSGVTSFDETSDDHKLSSGENSEHYDSFAEPTMWLGTEDGSVHIYNCTDNLRVKRNRVKIQHPSAVCSIIYLEKRVFLSLANGDVYVYTWDQTNGWNTTDPTVLTIGCAAMPVSKMLSVREKLWCVCHNTIKVLSTTTLQIEKTFSINGGESNRAITGAAISGLGVWLSIQNSALVRLIHATRYETLSEVNVTSAVTKMLSCCDDIIRQHKAACLRITSLMACKDRLWIGTSAGVILTLTLPTIKANSSRLSSTPTVTGVPHGHTGHVRFLTAVRNIGKNIKHKSIKPDGKKEDTKKETILVISGGDGYEDFRTSSVSEIAGREDSTNHLLLWRV